MKSKNKIKTLDKILLLASGLFIAALLFLFVYYAFLRAPAVIGTVSYDKGSENLPEGSRLVVQLRDISYQDVASELIAEQIILDPVRSPVRFRVEYEASDILDTNTYSVAASIYDATGRLLFINETSYEVITNSQPRRVDMELVKIPSRRDILTPPSGDPTVPPPDNTSLRGIIEGAIRYENETPLPEDAELTVQLRDASDNLIAEQVITNPGSSPASFKLDYNRDDINSSDSYLVSAQIKIQGRLLFIKESIQVMPLFSETDNVELDLKPVKSEIIPPQLDTRPLVTGVVNYDNQVNLPQGVKMVVRLEEISKEPFGGNTLIAEKTIPNPGQSPARFEIAYSPDDLSGNDLYLVLVRVYGSDGQTILTNNFPNKAFKSNQLQSLSIDLTVINPPEDSILADNLDRSVTGRVTYAKSASLPEGSRLTVQIRDTSYQDAPSDLIAEQVIVNPGKSPVKFEVKYDSGKISKRRLYSLSISIRSPDNRLLFVNDTVYEVITLGHPNNVRVPLISVRR